MQGVKIKDLKKGEYFVLSPNVINACGEVNEDRVYVRCEYDRETKLYSCVRFSDVCSERFFKGDKIVYTDFIF